MAMAEEPVQTPQPQSQQAPDTSVLAPCPTCPKPLLAAEKLLIGIFIFFVGMTILLIVFQSRWYYATFAVSLVVLMVTYKEGLVAMGGEE